MNSFKISAAVAIAFIVSAEAKFSLSKEAIASHLEASTVSKPTYTGVDTTKLAAGLGQPKADVEALLVESHSGEAVDAHAEFEGIRNSTVLMHKPIQYKKGTETKESKLLLSGAQLAQHLDVPEKDLDEVLSREQRQYTVKGLEGDASFDKGSLTVNDKGSLDTEFDKGSVTLTDKGSVDYQKPSATYTEIQRGDVSVTKPTVEYIETQRGNVEFTKPTVDVDVKDKGSLNVVKPALSARVNQKGSIDVTKPTVDATFDKGSIDVVDKGSVDVTKPDFGAAKPDVTVTKPDFGAAMGSVDVTKPTVDVTKPTGSFEKPSVDVTVDKPDYTDKANWATKPDVDVVFDKGSASGTAPSFDVSGGDIALSKPALSASSLGSIAMEKPDFGAAMGSVDVTKPTVDVTKPSGTVMGTKGDIDVTKPDVDFEVTKGSISGTKPDVDVTATKGDVAVTKQEGTFDFTKGDVAVTRPIGELAVDKGSLEVEKPTFDITKPSATLTGTKPDVTFEKPSATLDLAAKDYTFSKDVYTLNKAALPTFKKPSAGEAGEGSSESDVARRLMELNLLKSGSDKAAVASGILGGSITKLDASDVASQLGLTGAEVKETFGERLYAVDPAALADRFKSSQEEVEENLAFHSILDSSQKFGDFEARLASLKEGHSSDFGLGDREPLFSLGDKLGDKSANAPTLSALRGRLAGMSSHFGDGFDVKEMMGGSD